MKKLVPVALALSVMSPFTVMSTVDAEENAPSNLTFEQENIAIDDAMDNLVNEVNDKIESGEEDIHVQQYVEEIDENIGIDFETEDLPLDTETETDTLSTEKNAPQYAIASAAKSPSGRKSYKAKVNGGSFSHTLLGEFVYGGGKVKSTTKEVRTSGFAFSHSASSKLTKLDPSVWSVHSTGKHKWLGTVGSYTGFGYTSYITVELYGSGNAKIKRATYNSGVN